MKGLVQPGVSFANGLKPKGLMCKTVYGNAICQAPSPVLTPINGELN